jgi:hypothetical protein
VNPDRKDTPVPDTAPDDRPQLKPFAQFLQEARKGGLHTELSEDLADLVTKVVDTGKKGSITLKLTVAPNSDGETVKVVDDIKIAAPKFDAKPTLFFHDAHGNLTRTNPRQPELPLRGVPGGRENDNGGSEEVAV